jgi:GNAT superfamily N-acetyltransferase
MIAYRDAGPADAPLLAELSRRTFVETFGHLYREEDLEPFLGQLSEASLRRELETPGFQVRLAEADGEPAGFAKLGPLALPVDPRGHAVELRQLYLLEPWQGRGIARAMMDWTLDEARGRRADEIYLSVWTGNHRARRFYAGYGFAFVAPYAFMVGDQADEDEIWRLRLRDPR